MATNFKRGSLYSIFIGLCFILTGCPNPCSTERAAYYTEVPVTYSPGTDSVRLGDTLYLTSEFSSTFIPRGLAEPMNYANAKKIANYVTVIQLNSSPKSLIDAVWHFNYINYEGKIYNDRDDPKPDGVQRLTYAEMGDKYKLKVGLIAKERGVYALNLGVGLGLGKKGGEGCDKVSFEPIITNADIHKHFEEKYSGRSDPLPRNSVYFFKVY